MSLLSLGAISSTTYVKCYSTQTRVNAVEIMLSGQLSSDEQCSATTTRKKCDVVSLIESMEFQWKADEVHGGTATRVIQALQDVLWHIDDSHATMAEQSCQVQELFQKFNGHNKTWDLQAWETTSGLTFAGCSAHSQSPVGIFQFPFWNRLKWLEVKCVRHRQDVWHPWMVLPFHRQGEDSTAATLGAEGRFWFLKNCCERNNQNWLSSPLLA